MISIRSAVVLALVVSAATAWVLSEKDLEVHGTLSSHRGTVGIVGGKNTTIQKHPYLVLLQVRGYAYCEGTILTQQWALTTVTCLPNVNISYFTVLANSQDGIHGTVYNLSKIVLHPRFDVNTIDYNFGCIKIVGKFQWSKTARPVRLPRKQPKLNTRFNVAGYGSYSYGKELGSSWGLSEAWTTWSPKKLCMEYFGQSYNITPRMGCGYGGGKSSLCIGDLGDGFVKKGVIYGMYSFYYNLRCDPKLPIVLSNVRPVSRWIRKITGAKYQDA